MRQQSLNTDGFEKFRKPTRKEIFLKDMEQIIPWKALSQVIKPYYPGPKLQVRSWLPHTTTARLAACAVMPPETRLR